MTNLIQTNNTTLLHQSTSEKTDPKPSCKLEKIRSNLLDSSGITDQLPSAKGLEVASLISNYMGSDDDQEKELALTLEDYVSNPEASRRVNELLISTGVFEVFTKQFSIFDREDMVAALGSKVGDFIFINSSLSTCSLAELETDPLKKLELHTLFVNAAIQVVKNYAETNDPETLTWEEDAIAALQDNLKKATTHEIQQVYKKTTLLKADWDHIGEWVKQVTALQEKGKSLLSAPVLKEGENQGITFTIKKNDKVHGYLYGTIHALSPTDPEHLKFLQISQKTQERLHECRILGTETRIDVDKCVFENNASLDFVLARDATEHGIANIGIDDEDREYIASDLLNDPTAERDDIDSVIASFLKSVYTGNLDSLNQLGDQFQEGSNVILYRTNEIRNKSMADNIDTVLSTCEKTTYTKTTETPKGFFAVGCSHLIDHPSAPVSLVQRLKDKGWTLESIK